MLACVFEERYREMWRFGLECAVDPALMLNLAVLDNAWLPAHEQILRRDKKSNPATRRLCDLLARSKLN